MISFIIIGKNEGWRLSSCLDSVFKSIEINSIKNYEVLYIDSESSDDSITRATKFSPIKIYQLLGISNAALARNFGANQSRGDCLFFIDGDMQLIPDFLPIVYSEKYGLVDLFSSGRWINYYYSYSGELIKKNAYRGDDKDEFEKVTGGLFLIQKTVWDSVGGMNPVFKKSQDIDLGLRLAKKKMFLKRHKELAAIHHTIYYLDKKRMWRDLANLNHLYGRSLLYRKHIFNIYMYPRLMRNDYSMLCLLLSLISLTTSWWEYCFLIYLLVIIFRSKGVLSRIVYFFFRDMSSLLGIVLFYPQSNSTIQYKAIT